MSLFKPRHDEEISDRVTRMETRLDNLASREWVQDAMKPIEDSIARMEETVRHQGEQMQASVTTLTERSNVLFSAHEQLLKQEAEDKRIEAEARRAQDAARLKAIEEEHASKMAALQATAQQAAQQAEAAKAQVGLLPFIERKAAPIVGFIAQVLGVVAVVGGGIAWWILNYVLPSANTAANAAR